MPGAIALGAFTFTMDALPGTPQIQNIIPTHVLQHHRAGPRRWLGVIGAIFVIVVGLLLPRMAPPRGAGARAKATARRCATSRKPRGRQSSCRTRWIAIAAAAGGRRRRTSLLTQMDPAVVRHDPQPASLPGMAAPVDHDDRQAWRRSGRSKARCWWASCMVLLLRRSARVRANVSPKAARRAVGGALLAAMNTASEYGFGGVIAALAGLLVVLADCAQEHSQSAGQRSDHRHLAGRHHRLGVGRHEHRAGGDVRHASSAARTPPTFRWKCCTAWPRWPAAAWTRCRTTAR